MQTINKVRKFWDEHVVEFSESKPSEYLLSFFKKIKKTKNIKILDLGCGAGRNAKMLYDFDLNVFACDSNKKMVLEAKRKLPDMKDKIIIADMAHLPYNDGYFDIIVSNGVFHNAFSIDILKRALSETKRVLRDGGNLLVNMFIEDEDMDVVFKKKSKYVHVTQDGLPIVLLPLERVSYFFAQNKFFIESLEVKKVCVSTGERRVFKVIMKKVERMDKKDIYINNLRKIIDEYDGNIFLLINKRIKIARTLIQNKKRAKMPIVDKKREKEIILRLSTLDKNFYLKQKEIRKIVDLLTSISKSPY